MKISDAIKQAEKNDEVKELMDKGAFLCSSYVIIAKDEEVSKWNLNYYHPEDKKMTLVTVTDSNVVVADEDDPLREKDYKTFKKEIKISAEDALEKSEEFVEGKPYSKIIVSLQKDGETEFWGIAYITKTGEVVNVKIDVETGKVLMSETSTLIPTEKFTGS